MGLCLPMENGGWSRGSSLHSILQVQKTRLMKLSAMRYPGFVMRYVKGNKATLHISDSSLPANFIAGFS